jgi:hypothetical protein
VRPARPEGTADDAAGESCAPTDTHVAGAMDRDTCAHAEANVGPRGEGVVALAATTRCVGHG